MALREDGGAKEESIRYIGFMADCTGNKEKKGPKKNQIGRKSTPKKNRSACRGWAEQLWASRDSDREEKSSGGTDSEYGNESEGYQEEKKKKKREERKGRGEKKRKKKKKRSNMALVSRRYKAGRQRERYRKFLTTAVIRTLGREIKQKKTR